MAKIIRLEEKDDPRLTPFANLRERTLRGESIFIAEGRLVAERLMASPYAVDSALISEEILDGLPANFFDPLGDAPLFVLSRAAMLSSIAGFEFHQGILALGRRKTLPTFAEGFSSSAEHSETAFPRQRLVVLPDAAKPDNLGLVFRSAAALRADGVVLGERCCDPFSRRALRVSMGGVLQTPIYQAKHLAEEIQTIKKTTDWVFFATILDPRAESLPEISDWPRQTALLFGNEYVGLSPEYIELCDRRVTIEMATGVDSLNLGVSVGIFLYASQNRS